MEGCKNREKRIRGLRDKREGKEIKSDWYRAHAAVTHDVYHYIDHGGLIGKAPMISGYVGLSIRQDLGPGAFIETGLLRKFYHEGIGFTVLSSYSSSNAIYTWLIPLRLGTKIGLRNGRYHLVPLIGYAHGINSDYGYGDG